MTKVSDMGAFYPLTRSVRTQNIFEHIVGKAGQDSDREVNKRYADDTILPARKQH